MAKIHRFIGDFTLQREEVLISDPALVNQIKNVLRLERGELVELISTGDAIVFSGQISDMKKDNVTVLVSDKMVIPEDDNQNKLILYCAILKKDNFELVVQKATELGVTEIVPVITDRTVKQNLNFGRLHKIAQEASEQSGRLSIPEIKESQKLKDIFKEGIVSVDKIFFCDFGGPVFDFGDKKNLTQKTKALFIGPEGGFATTEREMAIGLGWEILTLSKNVLRAETAALVGVFALV